MPARPTAAATFTFAGNALAPSVAEPLKINFGSERLSKLILLSITKGALDKALGGFRVIIFTSLIFDSDAARNASKPNIAPVAKIICVSFFFAKAFKSRLSRIPEPLTVISVFLLLIHLLAICLNASLGAQSINISELSTSSSRS